MSIRVSERLKSQDELYRVIKDNILNTLRVSAPGIIDTFDPVTQTATVQIAIREKVTNIDMVEEWVDLPLLLDVPIVLPRAGNFVLTMPITKGDEVLVIFGDMCIDAWWNSGGVQNQIERRRHDLSDAFAIPGIWSQPNKLTNYSTTSAQIRTLAGNMMIELGSLIKLGNVNGGNYLTIEADGTLKNNGNSTVYNDLQFAISSGRVGVSNAPSWTNLIGNLSEYTFAVNDFIDLGSQEIPHSYKEGSTVEIHIHWATNGTNTDNRAVKWEIEYSIQNDTYVNGIGVPFSIPTVITAETTIPANTPTKTGCYTSIGVINDPSLKFGSQIKMRLRRITSTGTAPTNNPYALQVGIHFEADTLGSRTTTGK